MTILHLERKFTSLTETFIVNQINTLDSLSHFAFTVKELNKLPCIAKVFSPNKSLSTKYLSNKNVKFYQNVFDEIKPTIIHSHFLTDSRFFHSFSKRVQTVPKICSCYGYDVSRFPKKFGLLSLLYLKAVFKEYDIFLAMSFDMKKDLVKIGCPEEKVVVHYYGTDTSRFDIGRIYEKKEYLNLLTIGSLVEKKGHLTVLKALALLKATEKLVLFKYVIVGNGKLKSSLLKFVIDNNLEENVCFIDTLKHGPEFNSQLEIADVFIHPSVTTKDGDKEGIPGTIVEAMTSGLPVISSFHAGIPEIITNEYNGLLIEEHDHIALAKYIKLLFENHLLRETLGVNAKCTAMNELDINIRKKNLLQIYADAIKNKQNEIRN